MATHDWLPDSNKGVTCLYIVHGALVWPEDQLGERDGKLPAYTRQCLKKELHDRTPGIMLMKATELKRRIITFTITLTWYRF